MSRGHGRAETRSVCVQPLSPRESGFPYCRALVTVRSASYSKKTRKTARKTRRYISSLKPGERTHAQWEALVRGHWSVENKTHWRRDALLAEDKIRSRNRRVVRSLVLLRNAALFVLLHAAPFDPVVHLRGTRKAAAYPDVEAELRCYRPPLETRASSLLGNTASTRNQGLYGPCASLILDPSLVGAGRMSESEICG